MKIMKKMLFTSLLLATASHAFAADEPTGPLAFPPIGNTLKANAKPLAVDAGPIGNIHIGGVLSGIGYQQSNASSSDDSDRLDLRHC